MENSASLAEPTPTLKTRKSSLQKIVFLFDSCYILISRQFNSEHRPRFRRLCRTVCYDLAESSWMALTASWPTTAVEDSAVITELIMKFFFYSQWIAGCMIYRNLLS